MKFISDSGYYHYRNKHILNEFLMLAHTYENNVRTALALLEGFYLLGHQRELAKLGFGLFYQNGGVKKPN